jgi:thymidylate kinase
LNASAAETGVSRFVSGVFRAWQQAQINFLILRNYEELPQFTTNDIDVLVEPAHRRRAEAVMLEAARESGFRLHNRAEFATLAFFFSDASNHQVHFDLFTDLKWRGFDFLCAEEFLKRKVQKDLFAIPHPAHEAATNLLAYMIYTGKVKEKYRQSITEGFRAEPTTAEALLALSYGQRLAEWIVQRGIQQEWEALEEGTGELRRALIFRQVFGSPLRTLSSFASFVTRLGRRLFDPPGLTVVLCGADGSGKSTAAERLIENLSTTFSPAKGRHFHWKPALLSAGRSARKGPATDPHGKPPRNGLLLLVYFGFHWFEFVVGSRLCFLPITFKGGLVLIDRYYYDFFIDQKRYRLKVPLGLVRFGYLFVKKPDLVLLLDAPPEVLQGRKQEVSLAETERQCAAYRALFAKLENGRIVDATQVPEKVAAEMAGTILGFMAQRANGRLRGEATGTVSTGAPSNIARHGG